MRLFQVIFKHCDTFQAYNEYESTERQKVHLVKNLWSFFGGEALGAFSVVHWVLFHSLNKRHFFLSIAAFSSAHPNTNEMRWCKLPGAIQIRKGYS